MTSCCNPPSSEAFKCNDFRDCMFSSTKARDQSPTYFRLFYERGDLPVKVEGAGRVSWKVQIEMLDYQYYLPIFFEGLSETDHPYTTISRGACADLIEHSDGCRILPVVPKIILPIKSALCTRRPENMAAVMKLIQAMVRKEEKVGLALVPYYRQILPMFNLFKQKNTCTLDGIVYGQMKQICLGDTINETLQALETFGGEDAYVNIKYLVPAYESCLSTK